LVVEPGLGAVVSVVVAGEHLDQGGFARAVVTDQGVHLTGPDVEVDIGQRLGSRERLRKALDPKDDPTIARRWLTVRGCIHRWSDSTVFGHSWRSPFSASTCPRALHGVAE